VPDYTWIEQAPADSLVGWVRDTLNYAYATFGDDPDFVPAIGVAWTLLTEAGVTSAESRVDRQTAGDIVAGVLGHAHAVYEERVRESYFARRTQAVLLAAQQTSIEEAVRDLVEFAGMCMTVDDMVDELASDLLEE
jgi:hypothetical protein